MTLVSAPAGFGKTTLLADWLAGSAAGGRPGAWLSLDEADNQPTMFWTYLVAAAQSVAPGIGARAVSMLQAPQPPAIESALTTLLNELSALPSDIVLILDDYHVIDASDVQQQMAFFVERLPPRIHLVIASRADPALPLGGLRGRGELTEIRAADLRFTPDEAIAYLNDVMGLDLTTRDVAALEGRTEGWIVALQLAALSMQGRDDVAGFIAGFSGDDRYIVDYLVEEVLSRQPDDVRSFLLRTSILSRLSGPLCDAVTGQGGGKAVLEALDRGNLFLVPLDDRRQRYRYHHLFADVLQARLLDEHPELVPELHRRASDWCERHAERSEAVRHAFAAEDYERAAYLTELAIPAMRRARQEVTMRRWLDALPAELFRDRPVLSVGYVGALMSTGGLERVEALLSAAERWLDPSDRQPPDSRSEMIVADEAEFRRLPGAVAMYRAGLARLRGDVPATMAHARRVLELVDDDDHLGRGAGAAFLGLAYWTTGDLDAGYRWYAEGEANLARAGHLSDVVGCAITMADIRIAQGRLRDAMRALEHGLQIATGPGAPLRGAADMHVGMSELLLERDDLEAASQQLVKSHELGEASSLPQYPYRSRVAAARIHLAQGDLDGALELFDAAARVYDGDFSPAVRPVAALKARAWIGHGLLTQAWGWARSQGLTSADELTYVREYEHATLARLILAQATRDRADHQMAEAIDLTERLLAFATDRGHRGSAIDILVVHALARHARRDIAGALASLERVATLAEAEGYVRVFVDEGPPMAALLKLAAKGSSAPAYVRRLLAATVTMPGAPRASDRQPLIEPLSDRELEVLRLLESDLDGPDIARELSVSLATVRTHTRNVYAKLGVNSRRAAVRRAGELGLLARSAGRRPTT